MAPSATATRPSSRRAEICRTAARIFRERGFDATSVRDITRALRMTKAGLYHYFDSKEALLFEIMTFGLDRVREEVIAPARSVRDPEARLRQIVSRHARITTRADGAVAHVFDEVRALTPGARRTVAAQQRVYVDLIHETLVELETQGRLRRDVDVTVATYAIVGMILWLPRWFRAGGRLTSDEVARQIADLALAAVLDPSAPRRASGGKRGTRQRRPPGN
jgi:AcrR family transcriptional regulator